MIDVRNEYVCLFVCEFIKWHVEQNAKKKKLRKKKYEEETTWMVHWIDIAVRKKERKKEKKVVGHVCKEWNGMECVQSSVSRSRPVLVYVYSMYKYMCVGGTRERLRNPRVRNHAGRFSCTNGVCYKTDPIGCTSPAFRDLSPTSMQI